jgi:ABC-type multidrug transport system ATPase subunit
MTVQENLEIGAYVPKAKAERSRTLELVYSIFPRLADRKKQLAGTMSGGEQQMLAVGRGLMLKPRLLMLDEPSLGLAPVMTDTTFEKIGEIHKMGTAILLVEQNVSRALSLVQRAYVLESGNVIMHGPIAELANNKQVQAAYSGFEPTPLRSAFFNHWGGERKQSALLVKLGCFAELSSAALRAGRHSQWRCAAVLQAPPCSITKSARVSNGPGLIHGYLERGEYPNPRGEAIFRSPPRQRSSRTPPPHGRPQNDIEKRR